jgi:hypothetical protein
MPKPKKTGYQTINLRPDTYQAVKKYAGKLQAQHGGHVTEDSAVKSLLKHSEKRVDKG